MKRWAPIVAWVILGLAISLPAQGRDRVTIHLKWLHGAQFAGVYAAIEEGYFDREDLDVELIEGAATEDVLLALADGAYDFVLADASRHLSVVAHGTPNVAVAAVFQIDPVVIFALSESGIRRPEDLVGRRVMSFPTSFVVPSVLGRVGLSVDDVELGPPSFDLGDLYSGAYDVWSGYATNEVLRARRDGHEVNVIYPTDYGVHLYGDVLIAARALVASDPDRIRRVVLGMIDGWSWVLDHVEEAAALSSRWAHASDPVEELETLRASLPFIHAGVFGLGAMTESKWREMAAMMAEFDLLPIDFDPAAVFTLEFLPPVSFPGP